MKLLTTGEMRALEAGAAAAGVSTTALMENAGLAIAQEVWMTLGTLEDRRILVLAGPGNNGGDGLVAARHLVEWGAQVGIYLLRPREADDPLMAPLLEQQVPVVAATDDPGYETLDQFFTVGELVIDALLGTGGSRPVEGDLAAVLERLGAMRERPGRPRLISVDLPTGVNPDTGRADPLAVAADLTVALGEAKVGLYVGAGSALAGRVQVVEIGIPISVPRPAGIDLLDRSWAKKQTPKRPVDANKGTFGKVLAVCGSRQYPGAPSLAAAAAYRTGAGIVTLALPESVQSMVASRLAEATYLLLPEQNGSLAPDVAPLVRNALKGYDVLLAGCGLGAGAFEAVRAIVLGPHVEGLRGAVIDADGLNALPAAGQWWERLLPGTVLTPHPGEMSRLTGMSIAAIQADRLEVARRFAAQWSATVVLKGANTVIAAPDGRTWLSPFANPALATGGTGDVLAGAIAGLLAQGIETPVAAALGVFLHGMAGEAVRAELGPAGLLASDLLLELPRAIKALVEPAPVALPAGGLFDRGGGGAGLAGLAGLGGATGLGGLAGLGLPGAGGPA